jgi:predicted PilT family ATPase
MTYCDHIQVGNDSDIHTQRIVTPRPTFIKVKVPHHYVGAVIGRGGKTIHDIEDISNTKILFRGECKYFFGHIW